MLTKYDLFCNIILYQEIIVNRATVLHAAFC